jgi:hypothetical protein
MSIENIWNRYMIKIKMKPNGQEEKYEKHEKGNFPVAQRVFATDRFDRLPGSSEKSAPSGGTTPSGSAKETTFIFAGPNNVTQWDPFNKARPIGTCSTVSYSTRWSIPTVKTERLLLNLPQNGARLKTEKHGHLNFERA